ncbi:MAG: prephenate dehydrogenase [Firmicutes bacterium]|nr:prephenate dehydrogenase [Bacillota bacterium]
MDKKIGIVGLGLIGASIALSLRGKVGEILAVDRDEEVLSIAMDRKIIDRGSTKPEDILGDADIVIFALYPSDIINYIKDNKRIWHKGQILMDVAGLKGELVKSIQEELPEVEFIGTHPMAGREVVGIKGAREELFLGTNFIITPTEKNSDAGIEQVKELALLLGVKKIFEMTPEEHDALIAYTSHIPHLLALALVGAYSEGSEKIVGRSFLDATRVANINEKLWSELFLMNKGPLSDEIDKIIVELLNFKEKLGNNDKIGLEEKMKEIKALKERIDK